MSHAIETFIKRALASAGTGLSVATLDLSLQRVAGATTAERREAGISGTPAQFLGRNAIRAAAMGVMYYGLREQPDALAGGAGALCYAMCEDFDVSFFANRS